MTLQQEENTFSRARKSGMLAATALASVALGPLAPAHDLVELTPTFPMPGTAFGSSIDVLDDIAAIGSSSYGGTVSLFERVGDGWEIAGKLAPVQDSYDAHFGRDVALFGDWLAVGAAGDDEAGPEAGAVYMYERSGGSVPYTFHSKILPSSPGTGLGSFGFALDGDGDLLAVGEPGSDVTAAGAGSTELFELIDDTWTPRQRLNPTAGNHQRFGWAIDVDGTTVAIGAPDWDDAAAGSGAVSVFFYDPTFQIWTRNHFLHPTQAEEFGRSVAYEDGYLVGGAPGTVTNGHERGALVPYSVNAFTSSAGSILVGVEDGERLGESATLGYDPQGTLRAAAGAPLHEGRGAVQVFEQFSGLGWIPVTRLELTSDLDSAMFGTSVCIDGYQVLGGAPLGAAGGVRAGNVRCFDVSSGIWSERGALLGRALDPGDEFGGDVAIAGDLAVVGSEFDSDTVSAGGAAYVFERDGGDWVHRGSFHAGVRASRGASFGEQVATDGERVLVSAPGEASGRGAAYVFERNAGGFWTNTPQVLVASDGGGSDFFGRAIALDGDMAVVGAYQADGASERSGAAYVFRRGAGGTWYESQKLTYPGSVASYDLGLAVALDFEAGELLVGAPGAGIVARYTWTGAQWTGVLPILPGASGSPLGFGRGISLKGEHLAISASYSAPSVHLYRRVAGSWGFREVVAGEGSYFGHELGYDGERLTAGSQYAVVARQRIDQLWEENSLEPQGTNLFGYPVATDLSGRDVILGNEGDGSGRAWICALDDAGPFLAYGFGDGSGNACPCGNESAPGAGEGCANSLGRGALLRGEGSSSIPSDDLLIVAEGIPPGKSARLFVGVRPLGGIPFGDGQRLVGTPVRRLTVRNAQADSTARWSVNHGINFWVPGDTRYFQVMYRDVAGGVCGNDFNTTSGLAVLFR